MFKSIQPNRISSSIMDQIKEAVFQNKLMPGDKLPSEHELMKQFNASRVTVREALRTLEYSGILEIKRGSRGGCFIKDQNSKIVTNFLQDMFATGKIKISDLTEVRLALEPLSAKVAASRAKEPSLKQIGVKIMKDNGLEGNFGAFRPNDKQLNLYVFSFRTATQVNYDRETKKLVAKDRTFRWDHFLTGMHARGGFEQDSLLSDAWGVTVDIVCLGMLIWVASGIYMWWKLRQTRLWGWVALGTGVFAFAVFLVKL